MYSLLMLSCNLQIKLIFIALCLALPTILINPTIIFPKYLQSCQFFHEESLEIDSLSGLWGIFNFKNLHRTVMFGKYNSIDVVIKINKYSELCDSKNDFGRKYHFQKSTYHDLILCPNHIKLQEFIGDTSLLCCEDDGIAEAILLQMLPAAEGWPIPVLYQHCKGCLIESYNGTSVASYVNSPWPIRAKIVSSILQMAEMFTFKHQFFGFYFSDFSIDNLVAGKDYNVVLVDLDHVIIHDRNAKPQNDVERWLEAHTSKYFESKNSFIFSTLDICQHHISDHNYYAVCKQLLSDSETIPGGLLRDIPQLILEKYPEIVELIDECVKPVWLTRFDAAQRLLRLLQIIKNDPIT